VRIAGFLRPRLPCQQLHKRRLSIHQEVEGGVDGVQVVEGIQALGASSQFAGSLRAAEEQNADQGDFVAMEIEDVSEAMLEFGDATIGRGRTGEALVGKRMECAADCLLVEIHHRLAIGFLVRGVLKSVQGQRIVIGRGDFFFDEATEDAGFDGRKVEVHANMIHDGSRGRIQR
jgi:hypothetical protein